MEDDKRIICVTTVNKLLTTLYFSQNDALVKPVK